MKVFLLSCIAMLTIAVGSQLLLTRFAGESSETAYSATSARPS